MLTILVCALLGFCVPFLDSSLRPFWARTVPFFTGVGFATGIVLSMLLENIQWFFCHCGFITCHW